MKQVALRQLNRTGCSTLQEDSYGVPCVYGKGPDKKAQMAGLVGSLGTAVLSHSGEKNFCVLWHAYYVRVCPLALDPEVV